MPHNESRTYPSWASRLPLSKPSATFETPYFCGILRMAGPGRRVVSPRRVTPGPAAMRRSDLLAELGPVVEELLEPDVGQRVLHELLEHRERNRRHVGTGLGGVDDVQGVADRGGQHLGLETLDAVDLADVADQVHADVGDVVETSEERADIEGARLRRKERLGRREAQGLVHTDALARQVLHRLETVLGERALDDGIRRDLRELLAFLHHALESGRDHLEAHVAGHDRADLFDEWPERTLLLGDQRGVGRDPVDDSQRDTFLDLAEARRIEKDLHRVLQLIGSLVIAA